MPNVYTFEHLVGKPQHQQLIFPDPTENFNQRFTMYTGEIVVYHGSEQSLEFMDFQYPILGTFSGPNGDEKIGILPINFPRLRQFRSAVANASFSWIVTKDEETYDLVTGVTADLHEIELALDPRRIINAVVLKGMLGARYSEITRISYRVSVLERMTNSPQFRPPIFIDPDSGGWTGKYNLDASGGVGPLKRRGIPQA